MRPPAVARAVFHSLSPRTRSAVLRRLGYFAPWEDGFDLQPPDPAPGECTGPPDFVGIGVQKAGTSWWYELIVDHPRVFARADIHKERHYFSHFGTTPFGPAELSQYHGWFPRPPSLVTGEWTPDYLSFSWVAPLLARAAPSARLLVLLRDPVERFRSGLDFRLSQGAPDDDVTVADAVRQGFYARSLRAYLDHFPSDQMLVLQYEACAADPAAHLNATYDFLGLEAHHPHDLRRPINVSGQKRLLDADTSRRLVDVYRSDVEDLVRLVPTIDLDLWPHFARPAG